MLDPSSTVPASYFCRYFNPLLHLKGVNLLHSFHTSLERWKVLQVFFPVQTLAVLEQIFMTVCPKLQKSQFLHHTGQHFTMRVVMHWHSLPREALDAPSLAVFKARLDGALSNLV